MRRREELSKGAKPLTFGKPRHQHGLSSFGSIRASNLVARQAVEQAAVNTLDAGRNISVEDRRDVGPR
jgi:hypothetical protein